LGTFLRAFTHGHVQQLDRAGAGLLAGLAVRVPGLLAGVQGGGMAFVDVDDTIREVHGYAKQAAAFGYTGQRGLNVQLATISTPGSAPVIARARLRRGSTASATGAGRLLAQAIGTARAAGVTGQLLCRTDSAYYGHAFVGTALRHHAWFSVTARMTATVTAAIGGIDEQAWTPIGYPRAVWEDAEQRWTSDAEVPFTAFTSRRKAKHVTCRLVVRRVKRLQPLASDGSTQGELFAAHRHHAFITNSSVDTVAADQNHRGHAIVEQVIAELKDGPLAHLPSGKYAANAAWLSCAVIAFNLARAAAVAARIRTARWATLRTRISNVPARIVATGRRRTVARGASPRGRAARRRAGRPSGSAASAWTRRLIVGSEATSPNTSSRPRSIAVSAGQSPPAASITTRSGTTLPGSCSARGLRNPASSKDRVRSSPLARAVRYNRSTPACDTTPSAAPRRWTRFLNRLRFTLEVSSLQQTQNPKQDRHFRSSTARAAKQDHETAWLVPDGCPVRDEDIAR
jgi:hypothetical protein